MVQFIKKIRLKKELGFLEVFTIAAGTTLSAGFFLLPGIAASEAGPAMVLAYIIAAVPLIPAMFSIIELATAMPRAGGVYFFLDRTLGPLFGTIGGIGTWLALILKVAFALVGMGAYISLFFPELNILPIALALSLLIGFVNLFGSKKSGGLQSILVFLLLLILFIFIGGGIPDVNLQHFENFFDKGLASLFSTAGLVYISYVGLTKVASLSEEVTNPEKNLPRGIMLALGTAIIIYVFGNIIMVGIIPMEELSGNLTPVALAAKYFLGDKGAVLLSAAAIFAFISVANAGTLSASRYPFAMSRDNILPSIFNKVNKKNIPINSILFTVGSIIFLLLVLNPTRIAKLASAFQLLIFALVCFAVIVMRESKIDSYDPGFKSPLYPWMQITGIITPIFLIVEMGVIPIFFSLGLVVVGLLWYKYKVKNKISRRGAIYHLFARLGKSRFDGLDVELRGILKEKGFRNEDQFEELVLGSYVIDVKGKSSFENTTSEASRIIAHLSNKAAAEIENQFLEGTRIGATPVTHGVALPHLRIDGLQKPILILVRCSKGLFIKFNNPLTDHDEEEAEVSAVFYLVSPEQNPTQHLRMLAQIAGRVDEDSFMTDWMSADDDQAIREALLHDERWLSLLIAKESKSAVLIGKQLKEIIFPKDSLVALIKNDRETIVPKGDTILKNGDRLTIIGDPVAIKSIEEKYQ